MNSRGLRYGRGFVSLLVGGLWLAACSQPAPPTATTVPLPTQNRPLASETPVRPPATVAATSTAVRTTPSNTAVFAPPTLTPLVIPTLAPFATFTLPVVATKGAATSAPTANLAAPAATSIPVGGAPANNVQGATQATLVPPAPPATSAASLPPAFTPTQAATTAAVSSLRGKIVFETASGGGIYVVNADGGGLRSLTTGGIDPAWSPNGQQVAFSQFGGPYQGLHVINGDGSQDAFLFRENQIRHPTWSPDGSQIAFDNAHYETVEQPCSVRPCRTEVVEKSRTLGSFNLGTRSYVDLPSNTQSASPSWLADGVHVLYRSNQGLAQTSLQGQPQLLYSNTNLDSPILNPAGNRVAMMRRSNNEWEIVIANPDGSGLLQLTQPLQSPQRVDSVAPAWSPDGAFILFLSNRTGNWLPYIINADGSNPRLLFANGLAGIQFKYNYAAERIFSWTR